MRGHDLGVTVDEHLLGSGRHPMRENTPQPIEHLLEQALLDRRDHIFQEETMLLEAVEEG